MSFSFEDIYKAVNRWGRDAADTAKDAKQKANWVWEALQGDFNPNRSVGQIGLDTAVCLVPGVDTVMDVRDLIANIIVIARTPTAGGAWFALVLTLIGFFPELGSVAKGVVKIVMVRLRPYIKHADDLTNASKMVKYLDKAFDDALPDIIQYLRHPKVQQFLTKAGVPDVLKWVSESIMTVVGKVDTAALKGLFNSGTEKLKDILRYLQPLLPEAAGTKIKQLLNGIVTVQRGFDKAVNQYIEPIRAILRRLAQRLDEMHWVAYTQDVNKGWIAPLSEQGARRLIKKHQPDWVKTAEPVLYKQLDPKDFIRTDAYRKGLAEGAPALGKEEIESFAKGVKARPLANGETLYRIIDPTSGSLSTCWITEKVWKEINANPELARQIWRGKLAVKPEWNQNGTYVKYTYNRDRDGDITVWEGPTAMQWLNENSENVADGFLEGGLNQVVLHPKTQIRNVQADDFVGAQFPDMVEGGAIKHPVTGESKPSGVRTKINDPRIEGPFETGWGFKDFEDQHDLIGLPNPMKE
ncbi:hypothetical protein [Denitromonas ohlonensis]|uniref:Uncharacterized protein n=2 Tax=Denitromonas TaxID=139331 RepID=A0A558C5V9_9RHOO|nr:hypothetical protein [Denitromonas ohlonensis]TVO60061.1 hypothetical protein FHP90_18975 [Denitromonas ohlonensis]TVO70088.1 hypothetical protein FHP89_20830 [Denitromonas ohlonensis]TVT44174.1 MAG: hypothetical protein FHP94_20530 [Denitromonas halophila]TVT63941.1 MAG: hypothetical protein FHP93_20445 [Denitromonas halophila]